MDKLYHHGIKGQRWGVRRYQNEDGSLTSAGKKRNNVNTNKISRKEKKELKTLERYLKRYGAEVTSAANLSLIDSKDYERTAKLLNSGRLYVSAKFKTNLKDKTVDVIVGKNTLMKTRIENGNEFVSEFVDSKLSSNYDEFVKYYNSKYANG